jgi:predicted nucleic acid-binding protein
LKELVIDAGPLIALFYARDAYHTDSDRGFQQLKQQSVKLLIPTPIVFEVYKWLLQKSTPTMAQTSIDVLMEELFPISISLDDVNDLRKFVRQLPNWQGSLEDATVIATAFRYRCPVWTINYRDFSPFKALEFWVPA